MKRYKVTLLAIERQELAAITLTGPGSLKIRDALNAAGQRGFNAAVEIHLARSNVH
jgi:hypothetical protein